MGISGSDPITGVRTADGPRVVGSHEGRSATSLYELLSAQAQRDPDAAAILALGRTPLTFGALLDQLDNIRATLNGCGLGRGDRIALLAGRGPETAVAALGIACCAACVPLNIAATPTELEHDLVETRAKALLVPETASAAVKDLARRMGILLLEYSVEESTPAGRIRIHGGRTAAVAQGGPATTGDLAFILRTSGTTAQAKTVPISHGNVVAWTDKSRRLFNLSPADRCLNLMPLCYGSGLNSSLMSPLAAGCAVICLPAFDAQTFLACMREFLPTWYTASFTYHQAILDWLEQRPNVLAGHQLRFTRAGSGPLPAHVRVSLEKILGVPVLEVYSTTETGPIAANPPDGKRKPGTVGVSMDNNISIMDVDGHLCASGIEGEVVVRGAGVFGGYENDSAANERVFRDGWYRTGDLGVVDADDYVKLIGRIDEVINRGGQKISPREVDEALLAHEAVAEAVSFPVPHATLHQEIAAAVVPRRGAQVTGDELRRFLTKQLAPFKVPRVILCTAELPKDPTGKLGRKGLAVHFGLGPAFKAAPVAQVEPLTETQRALLALWRDALKRQDIGLDDDFFLLGGNSLSAVDLLHSIEKELQYQLPLNILMEAPTVRQLEDRLGTATLGAINNTLHIHTAGTQRPLFAVSGRYGHCFRLFSVLRALGSDQPCYGLQPPGMDWTTVECATVPEMAAHYIGEVKAVQPHGPYRLLGGSFGGLVVFEMALQLQRMDEAVEFLALIDTDPPTCLLEGGADVAQSDRIEHPEPENWIEALNLRVAETHMHAARNYVLDTRSDQNLFRGELTYFYCKGNPIVAGHDRRRLWQQFAPATFRLLPLPGPHGLDDHEPTRTALQNLLRACLNGEPPTESDPAMVFCRTYRIEKHAQRESILSSMREVYCIEQDGVQGYVDTFKTDTEGTRISGWAVEHCQRKPAQTVAVFLGDRFLGYGASGISRPDVAKHLAATSAQYAGFSFNFRRVAAGSAIERPRLFVLSSNGRAAELRFSAEQEAMTLRAEQSEKMRWRITAPLRRVRRLAERLFGR